MKNGKFKMNFTHFRVCVRRYFELILNDRVSAVTLMLQAPIMLLLISFICPYDSFSTPQGIWNADNALFIITVVAAMMGILNSYREVCKEREIFAREYDAGLDVTAYILSKVFVLGCVCLIQSFMLFAGSYIIIDFPSPQPVFTELGYWLTLFLVMFSSSVTGIFISCVLKSSDSAVLPVLLILIMQVVLAGNTVDLEGTLGVISTVCVSRWGLSALGQVFDRNNMFPALAATQRDYYNESLLVCYLVIILMCVVLTVRSIIWLKLSFKKRQKKMKN